MIDKRSKERAKQHKPHGWRPRPGFKKDEKGRTLMECPPPCNWLGWVYIEPDD